MRRGTVLAGIALLVLASALVVRTGIQGADQSGDNREPRRPNVVIILTNDQRWDTLRALPAVRQTLVRKGVTFENAFVVNPSCCPSRSSILTGLYSHSTGVFRNRAPNGGFESFDDSSTLPVWLDRAGYETALVGEYLNGYHTTYIPPGWGHWFAFARRASHETKAYYDYEINVDGEIRTFGHAPAEYSTDVLTSEAVRFIDAASSPFFLYYAPAAPHPPALPPPRYAGEFADLSPWRPPSYNERDPREQPRWLTRLGRLGPTERARLDETRREQYRSLLAVDDGVARIVDALRQTDRLADTLLLFLSDNGYLWGEHGINGKGVPYEESIRIPLVLRYEGLPPARRSVDQMVLNIDVAPTIAELAGVDAPPTEGRSLVPLLTGVGRWHRRDFLIDHLGKRQVTSFCAVRTTRSMYAAYADGSEELYRLRKDPFELDNRIGEAPASVVRRLRRRAAALCDPPPPGFGDVPLAARP
ncbi:MAG TPA: sulfatase [Actinomycetota bacterium]|jgi:arylsulfatase A-like enzyme|nr:sulfatase [Actinomycetota bacterium]